MKILALLAPREARDLLAFNLEAKLGVTVLDSRSEAEAIGLLVTGPDIDLVLLDLSSNWKDFIQFVLGSGTQLKCVCIHPEKNSSGAPKSVLEAFEVIEEVSRLKLMERLSVILSGLIQSSPKLSQQVASEESSEYIRITTGLLMKASPLKSDVYVQLSATKYVKLFLKGDSFDKLDLEKYLNQKRIDYLFLKKAETAEFLNKVDQILNELLADPLLTHATAVSVALETVEVVHDLGIKLGFTPDVQKLVKSNIQLVMKAVSKDPKLSEILKALDEAPQSYIATHSLVSAQLACSIGAEMAWDSEMTSQKLISAAMLHDITFKNQKLAAGKSVNEVAANAAFTQAEKDEYKNHPIKIAELVKRFPELAPDVDVIILQHHEQPDGSGFPRGLHSKQISPLACLFIVAHEVVSEIIRCRNEGAEFQVRNFLAAKKELYSTGNFKKVAVALAETKLFR